LSNKDFIAKVRFFLNTPCIYNASVSPARCSRTCLTLLSLCCNDGSVTPAVASRSAMCDSIILRPSPYRAVNTLHIGYMHVNQSVNVVQGSKRRLFYTHTRSRDALSLQCEQFRYLDSLYVFDATFQYTRQTIYHHTTQAIRTLCHSFYTAPRLATRFVNLYLRKQ